MRIWQPNDQHPNFEQHVSFQWSVVGTNLGHQRSMPKVEYNLAKLLLSIRVLP